MVLQHKSTTGMHTSNILPIYFFQIHFVLPLYFVWCYCLHRRWNPWNSASAGVTLSRGPWHLCMRPQGAWGAEHNPTQESEWQLPCCRPVHRALLCQWNTLLCMHLTQLSLGCCGWHTLVHKHLNIMWDVFTPHAINRDKKNGGGERKKQHVMLVALGVFRSFDLSVLYRTELYTRGRFAKAACPTLFAHLGRENNRKQASVLRLHSEMGFNTLPCV